MKKAFLGEASFWRKKAVTLIAGTLFLALVCTAGTPELKRPVMFTLAASDADPAPTSFTLVPLLAGSMALAGSGNFGLIEDSAEPYRTAIGYQALYYNPIYGSTEGYGYSNTAVGYQTLFSNTEGFENAAVGYKALFTNTTGYFNTAIGTRALQLNTGGGFNTAIGTYALRVNTTGNENTATGTSALGANESGYYNTATGTYALEKNTTGHSNTANGTFALWENTTGHWNTAVGNWAGRYAGEGNFNIYLGALLYGEAGDKNTIRIGLPYDISHTPPFGQNRTFIAGIVETPLTEGDVPSVIGITEEGRLGTMSSDLLPPGPEGPQGPPGEGLVSGSVLILPTDIAHPTGYNFLGSTQILLTQPDNKVVRVIFNVYQRQ